MKRDTIKVGFDILTCCLHRQVSNVNCRSYRHFRCYSEILTWNRRKTGGNKHGNVDGKLGWRDEEGHSYNFVSFTPNSPSFCNKGSSHIQDHYHPLFPLFHASLSSSNHYRSILQHSCERIQVWSCGYDVSRRCGYVALLDFRMQNLPVG